MANYEDHAVVRFARLFLEYINKGKIEGFPVTDKILLQHVLRDKVKEYDIVKLLDQSFVKNKDIIDKYNLPYKSLSLVDEEFTDGRKVYSDINIKITGSDYNVMELRLPFLPKNKFEPLIKFFKEDLDMTFTYKSEEDPIWWTVIRDETVLEDLLLNDIVKEVGYSIDVERAKKAVARIRKDKKTQKQLFKLSATADLGKTEEFKGMIEKMFPFQKVGLEYSKYKHSMLIADEMGLGKTLQALAIAEYQQLYPILCIVPANLKNNWKREVEKWIPHRSCAVIEGTKVIPNDMDIYIVSYRTVSKTADRFVLRKPKLLICDESHYLKNPEAQRTEKILDKFKKVPFKILTTGTPILNRTIELLPQLDLLGVLDSHFGGQRRFKKRYAPAQYNGWGTTYGSANEEELQIELRKSCMIRRMKKDVLSELPDKMRQVIPLPLTDRKAYNLVVADSINWYERKLKKLDLSETEIAEMVNDKLDNRSAFAEKMVKVEYLRQAAVEYKMPAVFDWVDNALEQVDKLILFAHHRETVEVLYEKYKENAVMLYGGMGHRVGDIVDKFVNSKKIHLFIASVQSGGIGIDGLQGVCDKVAFVELPWTPAIIWQAEDRVHRIGQKESVNIYYLIGENTIEEYVYQTVIEKEEMFEKTTNINKLFTWMKMKQAA